MGGAGWDDGEIWGLMTSGLSLAAVGGAGEGGDGSHRCFFALTQIHA